MLRMPQLVQTWKEVSRGRPCSTVSYASLTSITISVVMDVVGRSGRNDDPAASRTLH